MKPPYPRLSKAPIAEAMIDFHVAPVLDDVAALFAFHEALRQDFPEERRMLAVQVELGAASPPSAPPTVVQGLQLWSADRRRVIQARKNGFAFSQLHPYDSWEALVAPARECWDVFVRTTKPKEISRFAVRYVNRIDLPRASLQFESYLRTFPAISPDLPQTLGGLLMRLVLPRPEERAMVTVTEAFGNGTTEAVLPFILDIDAAVDETQPVDGDAVWQRLNGLRGLKNEVFFGCLTPEAVELFK